MFHFPMVENIRQISVFCFQIFELIPSRDVERRVTQNVIISLYTKYKRSTFSKKFTELIVRNFQVI